jgi:hypothetical protein
MAVSDIESDGKIQSPSIEPWMLFCKKGDNELWCGFGDKFDLVGYIDKEKDYMLLVQYDRWGVKAGDYGSEISKRPIIYCKTKKEALQVAFDILLKPFNR